MLRGRCATGALVRFARAVSTCEAVSAGHICLDITPLFPKGGDAVGDLRDMKPGYLYDMDGVMLTPGGSVGNTGPALSLMGVSTRVVGLVGKDDLGGLLGRILEERFGVTDGLVPSKDSHTSYSVVMKPPKADRTFLHDPGANGVFGADVIEAAGGMQGARVIHIGYPTLMRKLQEKEEMQRLLSSARREGTTTSMDVTAIDLAGPSGRVDWIGWLRSVLPLTDIFVPSFQECMQMLMRDKYLELAPTVAPGQDFCRAATFPLCRQLSENLISQGVAVAGMKLGARGLYIRTAGEDRIRKMGRGAPGDPAKWANRELFSSVYNVKVTGSTTGAGDSAEAGFLVAMLRGRGLDTAINVATMAGTDRVRSYDARGARKLEAMEADFTESVFPKTKSDFDMEGWQHAEHPFDMFLGPRDSKRK